MMSKGDDTGLIHESRREFVKIAMLGSAALAGGATLGARSAGDEAEDRGKSGAGGANGPQFKFAQSGCRWAGGLCSALTLSGSAAPA